jgi:hypothetical protein
MRGRGDSNWLRLGLLVGVTACDAGEGAAARGVLGGFDGVSNPCFGVLHDFPDGE